MAVGIEVGDGWGMAVGDGWGVADGTALGYGVGVPGAARIGDVSPRPIAPKP